MNEPWMESDSGHVYQLFRPSPSDIFLADIATGLSLECRYANQLPTHYSVAQHSVLVCQMMQRDGLGVDAQSAGLMHDASEAILGDMHGILKAHPIMAAYRELHDKWMACILAKFGLSGASRVHAATVDLYDKIALNLECKGLNRRLAEEQCVAVPPHHEFPHPVSHEFARVQFLAECKRLGIQD